MGLSPGSRLGPYEIVALLGSGGMGEVYRARDTRLGREVAIKVLPPDVTGTPAARARFEREARAISHLNHPNICTLHDVGREGETDYLVMELVTGGSLRDRLARKPLTLDQVLTLGIEIADALDAAHAKGIVHRDLKPGNVLLTDRGQAKVMDFGLAIVARRGARAVGDVSATGVTASATTETEEHLTSPGAAVGTVAYMSPEQARGEEVDARSDVFSLGAVLYEMASGHRSFQGGSTAVIFEAILNRDPAPVSLMKPGVPQELDRILGKALEKDRELRYQTAAEVRSDLKRLKRDLDPSRAGALTDSGSRVRAATDVEPSPDEIRRRRLVRIAWFAAAVVALAVGFLAWNRLLLPGSPPPSVRLSLDMPPSAAVWGDLRISPDGRYLAFTATDSTEVNRIWIRDLAGTMARSLPGTEGGEIPFWAPDSRHIGYRAPGGKLKTLDITGASQPVTVCESVVGDGTWGRSGTILFDGWSDGQIVAVPATGGQLNPASWLDKKRGETGHLWPQFLPDGRHFLYLATIAGRRDSTALRVGRLGSRESKILAIGDFSRIEYVPPGYILYVRGRTLLAQPFDAKGLRLKGDAFPVVDDVARADAAGRSLFSASATGTLVYASDVQSWTSRVVVLDRTGREIGELGTASRRGWGLDLSPDGKRVAVTISATGEPEPDIWILDVEQNVATRFTSDPSRDHGPIWSADGRTIYFSSLRRGDSRVFSKPSSGIGEERELEMPPGIAAAQAVTPDGRLLLAGLCPPGGKWDVVAVTLEGEPKTTALGIGAVGRISVSPDGKWLAYSGRESGRDEVYVVNFPGLTGKWRVSANGGIAPRWSPDGREIYFLSPDLKLMAAPVSTAPGFRVGAVTRTLAGTPEILDFAPAPDGKRFLALVLAGSERRVSPQVLLNWPAALRRR